MKQYIFSLLLCIVFSFALKAQEDESCHSSTPTTVMTPMSTTVNAWIKCEMDSDVRASWDNEYLITRPNSEQIKLDGATYSSTGKFNCHGYAFVKSISGTNVWIGLGRNDDEYEYSKYLTDGTYIEVTQPQYPGIISWGQSHSAVATDQSGVIIEKVGGGPLLKHSLSNSIYGTQGLRYYIKSNGNSSNYVFSLTASSTFVCPGTTVTYTLNPVPANTVQITWENSSHLTLVSSSNASATFTANSVGNGWVRMKASISNSVYNNTMTLQYKTVQISSCPSVSITGPSLLCAGSSGTFTVSNAPSGYTWTNNYYLSPGTGSGNNKTFTASNSNDGLGWIAVNQGSVELARKEVWVGKPTDIPSQQTANMPLNTPTVITPSLTAYRQKMGITNFYWVWDQNNGATLGSSYGATATVTVTSNSSSRLHAYGINSCGGFTTGAPMFIYNISRSYTSSSYSMSAYPNPVSSVLNVDLEELEAESGALSTAGSSLSSSGGISRATPVYTISLYSVMGVLTLQTAANGMGNIQLNVGSLPSGIYTLHVHDGTDSPPLTQHIVISH
jgi:hypothetical protein